MENSEVGMVVGENTDRTGSSSGASTPGEKEGEKSSTKRVTRSKGGGKYIWNSAINLKLIIQMLSDLIVTKQNSKERNEGIFIYRG